MRAFFGFFLGLVVGVAVLVGVYRYRPAPAAPPSPSPSPLVAARLAPSKTPAAGVREVFLLARVGGDGAWQEIILGEGGQAQALALPAAADRSVVPLTDGERIYAYVKTPRPRGSGAKRLVALTRDGTEDEVIAEETPLISLRGLFPAPDGKTLAFFHDDRRGTNTELWTYDVRQKKKRVAVENLSPDFRGPFFGSDGSFLLEDRGRVWAGSPRRTGADLLPVTVPDGLRWERGIVRVSPGGPLVVVTEEETSSARVARVVELSAAGTSPRARHAVTGERLRLLGVGPAGDVVAVSEAEQPTLWALRTDGRASFPLGAGARSPVLAADGSGIAFLRSSAAPAARDPRSVPDTSSVQLLVLKIPDGSAREVLRIPLPAAPTAAPAAYRLFQYLRVPAPARVAGGTGGFPAGAVLTFVSQRIVDLAEAPPGEPVSPERVWFTRAPDAFYVEYRVGTTLWRRLVRITGAGGVPAGFSVLGVFTPAEGEWALARGEDLAEQEPTALYEFDPDFQQWVEKPGVPLEAGRL